MATIAQLQAYARQQALRYGVNPTVFLRQISQESGWNPSARSSAGAEGIAQIMPSTAASWGVNPLDPRAALEAAARHDAYYLHQYGGNYRKMLAAYNAGPGAVASGAWQHYAQTTNYVQSILAGLHPHQQAAGGSGPAPAAGGGQQVVGGMVPAPISVAQAAPQPTALDSLQQFITAHAPAQPVASSSPTPAPLPSAALVDQLSSLHSSALKAA